jgi:hypothetical protein
MTTTRHETQQSILFQLDKFRDAILSLPPDTAAYSTLSTDSIMLDNEAFHRIFAGQTVLEDREGRREIVCDGVKIWCRNTAPLNTHEKREVVL